MYRVSHNVSFLLFLFQQTALHIAAFNGHGSIVRALVEAGADVNAEDEDGEPRT